MSPPISSKYTEAKTGVFWDVTDCPIPDGLDPASVHRNIKSALARKGYHGEVTISPYCDKNQFPDGPDDFESAGMKLIPAGVKHMRRRRMLQGFTGWVLGNVGFSNFMVISRNGMDFAYSLESLKDKGHNILFANPQHGPRICECDCETRSYDLATGIWVWETLAAGGDPVVKTERDHAEVSNEEDDEVKDSVSQDLVLS